MDYDKIKKAFYAEDVKKFIKEKHNVSVPGFWKWFFSENHLNCISTYEEEADDFPKYKKYILLLIQEFKKDSCGDVIWFFSRD